MNIEHSDTFGNYLIHGVDEIILPDGISWWPSAPGWKVLGVVLALWLIWQGAAWLKRWWRNRYRRQVLQELAQLQAEAGEQWHRVVSALPFYLKATALQAYPRLLVASLSGQAWLQFLDAHCEQVSFCGETGKALLAAGYLPPEQWAMSEIQARQLIEMCRCWIANHEVEHA